MVELPQMPMKIAKLPRDDRGYPVPWFVHWENGKPVFPAADGQKWRLAVKNRLCWVCGQKLPEIMAFVIGPMCGINRTSAEPPCHIECAMFSAKACPFLTKPKMKRVDADHPGFQELPGVALTRNPGCCGVWVTKSYQVFPVPSGGYLIEIGEPTKVHWFAEGREASYSEVMDSITSGLPSLQKLATEEGPASEAELIRRTNDLKKLLPA